MPALRDVVRYGYAPFMMLGLTGARLLDRGRAGHRAEQSLGLPLAGAAAGDGLRDRLRRRATAPFFDEWNDHDAHGDTPTNILHILVYEMQSINGVLLIPLIVWLFPFQGIWPTRVAAVGAVARSPSSSPTSPS